MSMIRDLCAQQASGGVMSVTPCCTSAGHLGAAVALQSRQVSSSLCAMAPVAPECIGVRTQTICPDLLPADMLADTLAFVQDTAGRL